MGKIKTREAVKNVKAIDKAAVAGERMKNAFIRSKDGTENLMDDRQVTPSEYAEDKVLYAAEDISHDTAHLAGSGIKKAANKGKEAFQRHRGEKAAEKLQEHSPEAAPPIAKQPSTPEPANGQSDTERSLTPQAHPAQQVDQPVSTGDSDTALYSDADYTVEQSLELAKKKTEQKAEVSKQIKQQTGKIAHKPEQTVKTADFSSGPSHTGESVRAAERPVQFTGKSVQGVKSSTHGVERSTRALKQTAQVAQHSTGMVKQSVRTMDQSVRTIKQTAKSTGKATAKTAKDTIKTSRRAVKTTQQTSKAVIKTARTTAKTVKKTAQATTKVARATSAVAKAMAKAAAATAKTVAKAVAAAGKAIIAGSKTLIAAIAAGGWVAVLVIVIICLIGLVVGSCYGIFFADEDNDSELTLQSVMQEIDAEYQSRIDEIIATVPHDTVEISGEPAPWNEVLAVYAVKTTTDPNNAQDVASMDNGKKALLEEMFWAMNVISVRTETFQITEYTDTVDENGNIVQEQTTVTKTALYITVSHKPAEEMAEEYGFTEDQREQLAALLAEENNSLWSGVLII